MKSGIYKITNCKNNKVYIGSSVHLIRRKVEHFTRLKTGRHGNNHLQNAYNLYGKDCFTFEVLEYCIENLLLDREQFWIDENNPEYNINPKAGNSLGAKHSERTKNKIKVSMTGRKHSDETKRKIGLASVGRIPNSSIKKDMSTTYKKVDQLEKDGTHIKTWDSLWQASLHFGAKNASSISKCCKGKYKTALGYKWRLTPKNIGL